MYFYLFLDSRLAKSNGKNSRLSFEQAFVHDHTSFQNSLPESTRLRLAVVHREDSWFLQIWGHWIGTPSHQFLDLITVRLLKPNVLSIDFLLKQMVFSVAGTSPCSSPGCFNGNALSIILGHFFGLWVTVWGFPFSSSKRCPSHCASIRFLSSTCFKRLDAFARDGSSSTVSESNLLFSNMELPQPFVAVLSVFCATPLLKYGHQSQQFHLRLAQAEPFHLHDV